MIENGNPENCFVKSFKDGSRFYKDFIDMLNVFADNLGKKDYNSIESKVLEALETSDIQKYLQCMCEIVVLYYIIRQHVDDDFCYEPKYNGGFNPECSFVDGNYRVNIEVKTPNYHPPWRIQHPRHGFGGHFAPGQLHGRARKGRRHRP